MSLRTDIQEIAVGGRNKVRVGDDVKIKPSQPRKQDGFIARVTRLYRVGDDVCVEVYGGRKHRSGDTVGQGMRTFPLDRIERIQQTRGGEKIARTRKAG